MSRAVLRRPSARAVVVATASALALAGCGSGGSGPTGGGAGQAALSPGAIVAGSYQKVADAKTAKFDMTFQLNAPSEPEGNVSFDGKGEQDFSKGLAAITVNAPGGQTIEQRIIGTTVYIKLPPGTPASSQLGDKTWLKTDLDKAAESAGLGSSGGGAGQDPSQILQMLGNVSDQVTTVGQEPVRGTPTTHYRADVDLAKAATAQGNTPQQAQRLQKLLGANSLPVDVWIGEDGLPHRMRFEMPLPAEATGGVEATMAATVEYYDFGTPVDVAAPSASETADLPLPTGGSTGSGGGTGTTGA